MSILRSGLALFGGRAGSIALGFVAIAVFARELGSALLGSFFLFQALLVVVSLVADAGLRGAMEKRISEGRDPGTVLATGLALKGILLAVAVGVVLSLGGAVGDFVGADLAPSLALAAVLRESSETTTAVLRGEIRVERSATVELLQKVTYAAAGIALVLGGFGVRGPVYALLAGYAAMTAAGVASTTLTLGRPSAAMARSLASYARFRFVSNVGAVGYSWVDVLVIGIFLSQAHVGAYEVAWKVASAVMVFGDSLATAAFPRLSEYAGEDARDRIERTFPRLVTPTIALLFPALFGTLVLSREALGIVFGPEYAVAALALVVLMANNLSSGVYRFVARTLRALDRPDLDARGIAVTFALNVAFNLALVPHFGLVGAALATTAASLVGNTLALSYLDRLVEVRFQWPALTASVVASGAMAAVVWVVRSQVAVDTAGELAALVGLGVAVYACLAVAAPPLRRPLVEGVANVLGYP